MDVAYFLHFITTIAQQIQKLPKKVKKIHHFHANTQDISQKLIQPELSGQAVFQSGVQKKALLNWHGRLYFWHLIHVKLDS